MTDGSTWPNTQQVVTEERKGLFWLRVWIFSLQWYGRRDGGGHFRFGSKSVRLLALWGQFREQTQDKTIDPAPQTSTTSSWTPAFQWLPNFPKELPQLRLSIQIHTEAAGIFHSWSATEAVWLTFDNPTWGRVTWEEELPPSGLAYGLVHGGVFLFNEWCEVSYPTNVGVTCELCKKVGWASRGEQTSEHWSYIAYASVPALASLNEAPSPSFTPVSPLNLALLQATITTVILYILLVN